MRIYFTNKPFQYFHKKLNKFISTKNKIPFIIDYEGKLVEKINDYLLMKTELDWDSESHTPRNNAQNIISFLDFCLLYNVNWQVCSGSDLRQYIAFLTTIKNKERTIKVKLSSLENMYNWLKDNNYLDINPFLEFNGRDVKKIVNVFSNKTRYKTFNITTVKSSIKKDINKVELPTMQDIKSLYDSLDKETQLMMFFILETGVRKEELLQLNNNDFDSRKVSESGQTYSLLLDAHVMKIKNNRSREIIISDQLKNKIQLHLKSKKYKRRIELFLLKNPEKTKDDAPIFISNRGDKYSADKLNKSFDKAGLKNGIKITPHQLRHFFASNFIYQKELHSHCTEQDYMYLAERLGHSSTDTTKEFYIKLIDKRKQEEEIQKYSNLFINSFLGD